jgi:hypothetical protein
LHLGQVDNWGGVRASWERRMFFLETDFLRLGKGTGTLLFKEAVSGQPAASANTWI